jgi:ABC-type Fe3+/spermidine/putrescine transport system ATPase subunit
MYFSPQSAFAAEFLGVSNQLHGTAEAGSVTVAGQRLPYAGPVRGAAVVVFKATDAELVPGPGGADGDAAAIRGALEERLFLGSGYRHYVRVGTETVMVDDRAPLEPGPVIVRVPAAKLQVYPAAGVPPAPV